MTDRPTLERETLLDQAILARLYDAEGELDFASLCKGLCHRRDAWRSLDRQYRLGNVKRHRSGQPLTLTSSARIAIAAGRSLSPEDALMSNVKSPSIPISPAAVKAAVAPVRPVRDDGCNDKGREANIRRASQMLALRIRQVHPERALMGVGR